MFLIKEKYIFTVHHDLLFNFSFKTPHQKGDMYFPSSIPFLVSLHEPNKGLGQKVNFSP